MNKIHYYLITLFFVCGLQLNSEGQKDKFQANTQNYFLKSAYTRLSQRLTQSSNYLLQEQETANMLSKRNDSMFAAGNMYDSTSLNVKERLNKNLNKVDSCNAIIKPLITSINNTSYFKKNFSSLEVIVHSITDYIFSDTLKAKIGLQTTKKIIDAGDLSGEKAGMKAILGSASSQLENEKQVTGVIGDKKGQALNSGNIDASVSDKIDSRLKAYQNKMDSLKTEISQLQSKLESPAEFRKDFKLIKAKVFLIDSVVNKGAVGREYIFKMLDDGVSQSTKKLFELAAFFGPGGYIIPNEKLSVARTYFSPIIDSLVKFSNSYHTVFRTASIIVNGYSDATSISPSSKLYAKLCKYLNTPSASKEHLNAALSALRAEEVSKLINSLLKNRYPDFKSIDKIVFETYEVGQGEKLPINTITDYKENDSRRRVVIIYWNILPME